MRISLFVTSLAVFLTACGSPRRIPVEEDSVGQGSNDRNDTQNNAPPAACTQRVDCAANEFCRFEGISAPYTAGTEGTCSSPCGGDSDCIIGQSCYVGVCYTNLACTNDTECPLDEQCVEGACSHGPAACTLDSECDFGEICNPESGVCINPNDPGPNQGCTIAADCNAVGGCEGGTCTCDAGACVAVTGCTVTAESTGCAAEEYCREGFCQGAQTCDPDGNGDNECFVYSLVCGADGFCTNAAPCDEAGNCSEGEECLYSAGEGGCFPSDGNECTGNAQCPSDEYCELFTGTCERGCRDDSSCVGECDGGTPCRCAAGATNQCTTDSVGNVGSSCGNNDSCPGGSICSYNSYAGAQICPSIGDVGIGVDCSKGCRQKCNVIADALLGNSCPSGQSCGGSGNLFSDLLLEIFSALFDADSGGSVCVAAN